MSYPDYYPRAAIDIVTALLYTAFMIHSIRQLRRHNQRLDKYMLSTLVLLAISLAHTIYIDFAVIFDWPFRISFISLSKFQS